MLDEYKELCKTSADLIPNWSEMSKNDLCRLYVSAKDDEILQNAYFSAILYKYWGLISKYYNMSANCASPEDCYDWLVDSVSCCVNDVSWENPNSSIYNDPNGPDKVINRCMKCARLTYYQFINRKKRRDDFGLLSIEELKETWGNTTCEPQDTSQNIDVSEFVIQQYIIDQFLKKNYFVSFLVYFIITADVFDVSISSSVKTSKFNIRKVCKLLKEMSENDLNLFSNYTNIDIELVKLASKYIISVPSSNMKKKVVQSLETLQHSKLFQSLLGG